ncbi:hypothetical protein BGAL_0313g00010 [Botrytis galanthina]|uniref:Uncharacterized protein n=1 Tax=Botrytis galanthina TaxID=278940 RepID=A0A4S8QQH1_9HELO|nr:hypothetical protein BGAL_0313g00010 [Botrytis galanthina]
MCWPSRTKYYREPVVREVVYAPRPVSRGHHHHHHPRRVSVTSVSSRPLVRERAERVIVARLIGGGIEGM